MARVAARRGENLVEQKHKRIHLTPTFLLMETNYAAESLPILCVITLNALMSAMAHFG